MAPRQNGSLNTNSEGAWRVFALVSASTLDLRFLLIFTPLPFAPILRPFVAGSLDFLTVRDSLPMSVKPRSPPENLEGMQDCLAKMMQDTRLTY